ncbi:MAG: alpha-glucosidase/alpha-galactosidase [Clostridiales bacterium]|jgi:alpha-galactosidase|nr:alpha-glucosidase/alpha-galactosidase [Clostridiales bacterium]
MKPVDEKPLDLRVAYIGGGSRGWAWGFMQDLAMDAELDGVVSLYDIDAAAAEKNRIIGNKISAHPRAVARWKYEVAGTLEDALTDADIVVISILPGTFAEMRSDVHTPEKYGIWQSVGDTTGPGGLVRAMRTVPMYVKIAEAIRDIAPRAWVINYTNPMSVCMAALYEVFPDIRAFGCCHEVFGTQELLSDILDNLWGVERVPRQEIQVNVLGVNHFTWFDSASYRDVDLFPLYEFFVKKYYDEGYENTPYENELNRHFTCFHRVKFDLFRRYGLIAAAGDRHLAEFVPAPWYLKDPETVAAWKFALTPVSWREEDLKKRLARSDALVSGRRSPQMEPSGEEGHLLIKALLGLGDIISNVNLPNRGQISNLPLGAIVETNALFRRGHILPVNAGSIPDNLLPLISRHAHSQRNILHAALNCDFSLALSALMDDPLMAGITIDAAAEMLRTMLENTKDYLPGKWRTKMLMPNWPDRQFYRQT